MHQLGLLTYAEFEAMPASEIDRWRQFFAEEPAGYHAENRRAGIVVATLLNVGLGIKRERQIKPSQIFPLLATAELLHHLLAHAQDLAVNQCVRHLEVMGRHQAVQSTRSKPSSCLRWMPALWKPLA